MALRARRLAIELSDAEASGRLRQFAEELEVRAEALEPTQPKVAWR